MRKIIDQTEDITAYNDGTFDISGETLERIETFANEHGVTLNEALHLIMKKGGELIDKYGVPLML